MDRFSKFHPIINFSFFMCVILLTLVNNNPVFLIISFIGSLAYLIKIKGNSTFALLFKLIVPIVLFTGAFNMVFCRYGNTLIFSIKGLNFTLECLVYGLCTGLMLADVIMWFSAYNSVVTSEKFMALFGRFAPNTALLFSMALRFIPLMRKTACEIRDAQIGLGQNASGLKNALKHFSALVSISLEKSVETAESMKARGFGNKKRKAYSKYGFKIADAEALIFITVLFICCVFAAASGLNSFSCNPAIKFKNASAFYPVIFFLLCFLPLLVDFTEDIKWLYLKSKI